MLLQYHINLSFLLFQYFYGNDFGDDVFLIINHVLPAIMRHVLVHCFDVMTTCLLFQT